MPLELMPIVERLMNDDIALFAVVATMVFVLSVLVSAIRRPRRKAASNELGALALEELASIERDMLALKEVYEAGFIAPRTYLAKMREYAARSL